MGHLRELISSLAADNSNGGRGGPNQPGRSYDASGYNRSPNRSYNSDSRDIPQSRYDMGYSDDDSNRRYTRRDRIRDRRDDRFDRRNSRRNDRNGGRVRVLDDFRGGSGQRRPTLIGGLRDVITSHMSQDQDATRQVRPIGYSNNPNRMQPAARQSPQFSQQDGQYGNRGVLSNQQSQGTVPAEDDRRNDYSGNENMSANPYYSDVQDIQFRRGDDLPPQYEARRADDDWNSRYLSRAISAPPMRTPREKEEYESST